MVCVQNNDDPKLMVSMKELCVNEGKEESISTKSRKVYSVQGTSR